MAYRNPNHNFGVKKVIFCEYTLFEIDKKPCGEPQGWDEKLYILKD